MLLPSGHDGGLSARLLRGAVNLLRTRHGAAERDFRVARRRRKCARNIHKLHRSSLDIIEMIVSQVSKENLLYATIDFLRGTATRNQNKL